MITVLYDIRHVPYIVGRASSYYDWIDTEEVQLQLATIFVGARLEYLFTMPNKEHESYYNKELNITFHINKQIRILLTMQCFNCNKIWNELNA